MSSVLIKNINSNASTITSQKGRYQIDMSLKDTLEFTHLGYRDELRTITETQVTLNVNMQPETIALEEVTVAERTRKRRSQKELELDYIENPNLVKTQFGIIDKETSGYALYVLTDKEFNSNATDLATAIAGRFPNRGPSNSIYNSNQLDSGPTPIYDIDGMVFTDPPNILPANIERIAYIPGLGGAAIYGTLGNSGVIIINTKVGTFSPGNSKGSKPTKPKGKLFDGNVISKEESVKFMPSDLKRLHQATDLSSAQKIYSGISDASDRRTHYSIEAYRIFYTKWGSSKFTDQILKDCYQRAEDYGDSYLMKLAFVLEELGEYDKAASIYRDQFKKHPNTHKSYMDMHTVYRKTGEEQKARNLLLRYFYLIEQGFLSDTPNPVLKYFQKEADLLNSTKKENGVYILLEWLDPTAEFEVQFVNPANELFSWNSLTDRSDGAGAFLLEDFFLDAADTGTWQLNGSFKMREWDNPVYVKLTFYFKNRGKESIHVKTIRFDPNQKNTELLRFSSRSFL